MASDKKDDSDDDFQPSIVFRKRMSRKEPSPSIKKSTTESSNISDNSDDDFQRASSVLREKTLKKDLSLALRKSIQLCTIILKKSLRMASRPFILLLQKNQLYKFSANWSENSQSNSKGKKSNVEQASFSDHWFKSDDDDDFFQSQYSGESSKAIGLQKNLASNTFIPTSSAVASNSSAVASTSSAVASTSSAVTTSSGTVMPTFETVASSSATGVSTSSASVSASNQRIMSIKTTVNDIWKAPYVKPLHDLVDLTDKVVKHTFAFSKFIFLNEITSDANSDLGNYINKSFFVEVFLSLLLRQQRDGSATGKSRLTEAVRNYRELIGKHKDHYFQHAKYILKT